MNTIAKTARTAFIAITLAAAGFATTAVTATSASAASSGFSITIGGGGYGHDGHRGHRRGHDRWDRGHRRGFCAPHQAVNKARHMGIRHARIVDANHRVVRVVGRKHGHRVRAIFANTWRCPVIAVR